MMLTSALLKYILLIEIMTGKITTLLIILIAYKDCHKKHNLFFRTLENKLFNHLCIMLRFSEATYDPYDFNFNVCSTNSLCMTTTFQFRNLEKMC